MKFFNIYVNLHLIINAKKYMMIMNLNMLINEFKYK